MDQLLTLLILGICVGLIWFAVKRHKKEREPRFCIRCHYRGTPKMKMKGSWAIELILWICFIIPGLIYSTWRGSSRTQACPECGAMEMIPETSPRAMQVKSDQR